MSLPEHRDVFIAHEKLQNVLTVLNDVLNDDANVKSRRHIQCFADMLYFEDDAKIKSTVANTSLIGRNIFKVLLVHNRI